MGTHPSGPSRVCTGSGTEVSLEDWIRQNPDGLGKQVREYFKGALPFLFKVLSVNTALSVQAHPNKVAFSSTNMKLGREKKEKEKYIEHEQCMQKLTIKL